MIVDCAVHHWATSKVVCKQCSNSKAPNADGSACELPATVLAECSIYGREPEQASFCTSCKEGFAFASLISLSPVGCVKSANMGCSHLESEATGSCLMCNYNNGYYATNYDATKGGAVCEKSALMVKVFGTIIGLISIVGNF